MSADLEVDDVRHTNPSETKHRRARFEMGWREAVAGQIYGADVMRRLTWQNLGNRLGSIFGETSAEQIQEMYDWCVIQQSRKASGGPA